MINVLIAETQQSVRRGLKQILEGEEDIRVTSEAHSVQELFEKANLGNFDVLVLDFDMRGCRGLEMLKKLKTQSPSLPMVVMSIHSEEQFSSRVLNAGARAFLPKGTLSEEIVKTVRKAYAGGPSLDSLLRRSLPT